jgi:hypothetical protein
MAQTSARREFFARAWPPLLADQQGGNGTAEAQQ